MTALADWAKEQLRYTFSDLELLKQALTHRSASRLNNERLEFLGDSLLNFVVAHQLYALRSGASEGDLSRARAALVRKSTLAEIGRRIAIDGQLVLGSGELRSGGAQRSSTLADAVEALIGAVLLDGGFDAAERLVVQLIEEHLTNLPDSDSLKDAKTRLQEWLQGRGQKPPLYSVIDVEGEDHRQRFTVVCTVDYADQQAEGSGKSRRAAEQDAAGKMLASLDG